MNRSIFQGDFDHTPENTALLTVTEGSFPKKYELDHSNKSFCIALIKLRNHEELKYHEEKPHAGSQSDGTGTGFD